MAEAQSQLLEGAGASDQQQPRVKRPKRTYRACLPCRSRKLKCDLGDPDAPSDGPCRRCRRESRDCVFTARPGKTFTRVDPESTPQQKPPPQQPQSLPEATIPRYPPSYPVPQPPMSAPHWNHQAMYSPSNPGLPRPLPPNFPEPTSANPYFLPQPTLHTLHRPPPPPVRPPSFGRTTSAGTSSAVSTKRERDEYEQSEEEDEEGRDDEDAEEEDGGHSRRASGSSRNGKAAGPRDSDVLLSSTLHNPSDALRLLATASSLRSSAPPSVHGVKAMAPFSHVGQEQKAAGKSGRSPEHLNAEGGWANWAPVAEGLLTQPEAEVLFSVFETDMSPLYPLLAPDIFSPSHLSILTTSESILLCAMITIAARYSSVLPRPRSNQIHILCANFIRQQLIYLHEGSPSSRHISSVEALLLLTEWPSTPLVHAAKVDEGKDVNDEEVTELLKASSQYDSMSWTYIGCAVRLAQELGIDNAAMYELDRSDKEGDLSQSWHTERILRTWIYCYNADRHVSVRLGRNAVIQAYMSSAWWEQVTHRASLDVKRQGLNELWAERTLPQGLMAALMGTIQDRLYPNKEITRAILRTGHWESFIRSLDHELRSMAGKTKNVLKQGTVESTLLQIEIDYVRLYGNAIALRALQERLRRRVKANDLLFVTPSLLNLQEGPWIIDSLAAAQSILSLTVTVLAPKGYLRLCPSRIFQRILFAATFLFKALAVGVIEHGQSKTVILLDQAITQLHLAAGDTHHISRGFAALLTRLQAQCTPASLAESGSVDPSKSAQQQAQQDTQLASEAPAAPKNISDAPPAAAGAGPFANATEYSFGGLASGGAGSEVVALNGAPIIGDDFGFELPWEWDPTAGSMAAGKEQDLLFQSLWSNQAMDMGTGSNPLLNLFGTLQGDEFGLDG